jgi:hypothetical protein
MTLTRRIDGYALGRGEPVAHAVPPPRGEQVA